MTSSRRLPSLWRGLAALAVSLSLAGPAPNAASAAGGNTLTGTVLLDTGGPAQAARLIALQGDQHYTTLADAGGAYILGGLSAGDALVNLTPAAVTTTSPNWVYAGGPQGISFGGEPLTHTLNFTVTAATAVITGTVASPDGSTFGLGNRVWVRAENQEGQGNTVLVDDATGDFSVNVLPGNVHLRLALENDNWAAPTTLAGSVWFVEAGAILPGPVGTLQLVTKTNTLTGAVLDENGAPVTGEAIPVRAWRLDGSDFEQTTTDAGGHYALKVISGTWQIRAVPEITSAYVTAQSPQTVVFAGENVTKTRDLRVALADVTVNVTLVNAVTGMPVPGLNAGRGFAEYRDGGQRWLQYGPAAPIQNGVFTLKLASSVATHYRLRAFLPASAGYTALAAIPQTVAPGQTYDLTLPIAPNNSTIQGTFRQPDGDPQLNLPGMVYAAGDSSGATRSRVNPLTGGYAIQVATTDTAGQGGSTWRLYGFVDPTTGYVVQRPRQQRVFIPYNDGDGAAVTADFTVAQINAEIAGRVTDPNGAPVPGALVRVRQANAQGLEAFYAWRFTGPDGRYRIRVPAGLYRVTADHRGFIAAIPQLAYAPANGAAIVNLQLRPVNAVIGGQVLYDGAPFAGAFVRARSNHGATAFSLSGPNGFYALPVNAEDVWQVQAVGQTLTLSGSVTVTVFLQSERLRVDPNPGPNPGHDLTLTVSDTLPDAMAFRFDAAQDQVLGLSNGAQVIVPAGALAPSGFVTLLARPLVELADDGGAQPVSFGYRLQAFDDAGLAITHFNAPVTLVIPFTADQLAALGVSAEQLVPQYWDVTCSCWKPVPTVSVQTDLSGNGTVNVTVEHFTDFALTASQAMVQVYLPLMQR